jgi:hypothetical protein
MGFVLHQEFFKEAINNSLEIDAADISGIEWAYCITAIDINLLILL